MSGCMVRESIEDVSLAVRSLFDIEASQLEPGAYRSRLDFIKTSKATVYREEYPLGTHIRGSLRDGLFGVAFPLEGPGARFLGESMGKNRLISAMSGEEITFHAGGGFSQLVVLMDQSEFLRRADDTRLERKVLENVAPGRKEMPLPARPEEAQRTAQMFSGLLGPVGGIGFRQTAEDFEDLVFDSIFSILDVERRPRGKASSAALFRRATALVHPSAGRPCISRLCAELRISHASLENAFKATTGLAPLPFFQRQRLNRARQALLNADPRVGSVTEIALGLGFTELGRFSVTYRSLFGEKPSETLWRRRPRSFALGATGNF
jgi:AraC family ethanolamine operon transcriptional activator